MKIGLNLVGGQSWLAGVTILEMSGTATSLLIFRTAASTSRRKGPVVLFDVIGLPPEVFLEMKGTDAEHT